MLSTIAAAQMDELIVSSKALVDWSRQRPASLAVASASHGVSKPKPKIRIVHIFAPEVIETDVANFRDLVQKLTGKPEMVGGKKGRKKKKKKAGPEAAQLRYERVEMTSMEENSDEFMGGVGDVDGFFQGFADLEPLLPPSSSDMDHHEAHVY